MSNTSRILCAQLDYMQYHRHSISEALMMPLHTIPYEQILLQTLTKTTLATTIGRITSGGTIQLNNSSHNQSQN